MLELYQYPAVWNLPSLSPFCIKVEAFLRHSELPYRTKVILNPARGPKGKLPFVRIDGLVVADSTLILQYLIANYDLSRVAPGTPPEAATGRAYQRLIEESLYFILLYSRWIDPLGWIAVRRDFVSILPRVIAGPFLGVLRRRLRAQAHAQGIGRHTSHEVYELGIGDLGAVSTLLTGKQFALGDRWTTLDATILGFLWTIIRQPIASPLQSAVREDEVLMAYTQREVARLFPDFPLS